MKRRFMLRLVLFLLCTSSMASSGSDQQAISSTLEVKGNLVTPRTFTLRELTGLPQTEVTETRAVGAGQQQETAQVKWRGVLLREVLNSANIQEKEKRDFRRTVIVARARDGYVALFSWGELFNTKIGDSVLVITSVDGKPLPDSEGPYALRALADLRPGPRHVKWLQQIEVMTLR